MPIRVIVAVAMVAWFAGSVDGVSPGPSRRVIYIERWSRVFRDGNVMVFDITADYCRGYTALYVSHGEQVFGRIVSVSGHNHWFGDVELWQTVYTLEIDERRRFNPSVPFVGLLTGTQVACDPLVAR